MRRLTLLRHAEAANAAGGRDFDRPLSDTGIREARAAAIALAAALPAPDLVVASSALRTMHTARLLRDQAWAEVPIVAELSLYLATADVLFDYLKGLDDGLGNVLIVGHNPGLSQCCARIADDAQDFSLGTGAWRAFERRIDRWADLR